MFRNVWYSVDKKQAKIMKQQINKKLHRDADALVVKEVDNDTCTFEDFQLETDDRLFPDDIFVNKKYKGRKKEFSVLSSSTTSNGSRTDGGTKTSKIKKKTVLLFTNKKAFELDEHDLALLEKLVGKKYSALNYNLITIGSKAAILSVYSHVCQILVPELTCIVKVFKPSFHPGYDLIRPAHLVAKREVEGLTKARNCGVACPRVIASEDNIVIMSFVGFYARSAKNLGEAKLKDTEYSKMYHQLVNSMKAMYRKENMIHGVIRDFNLFWHENKCFIIDFTRCVDLNHGNASVTLYEDCINVYRMFHERNVKEALHYEELYKSITGFPYTYMRCLKNFPNSSKGFTE